MLVQFIDRESGERRWSRIKAKPVRDADGSVRLAINVIEDVTGLKQVEQSQRFLAEASRALADSLEYESTLASIAQLAVPVVADWCAVDLGGDADGELDRVAVAHVDAAKVRWACEIAERYPADPRADRGVHHVLRTGESQLWPDIPDELIVASAQDEEHLRLIRALGMTSAMMVPMRVRDRVFGVISFVSAESGRHYSDADLRLAEDLALRAATAVENARLYQARTEIARTLQASLLPPVLPDIPGIQAGALYRAAGEEHEVGGDFYDVFRRPRTTGRRHRRRLRQGRGGGGGHGAGALHDPRRGGPGRLAGRDPALGQRRDAAPGLRALLHDRLRPPRPLRPRRRGSPSPSAAIRRRSSCAPTAASRTVGAAGTLIGLVEDPRLAETHDRARPRRRRGALHGRRHRGRRAAPDLDARGARRGDRGGRGSTAQELVDPRGRRADGPRRRRRATTSPCWRCGSPRGRFAAAVESAI